MKVIKSRFFKIVICLFCLIFSYWLTEFYLNENFKYNGESYRKSLGGILWENYPKGFFFIFIREFLVSIFFSAIIYLLIKNNQIIYFFKNIIVPIWILILLSISIFVGIKFYDIYSFNYNDYFRLTEILITWFTRALGFLNSYLLIKKYILEKELNYNTEPIIKK